MIYCLCYISKKSSHLNYNDIEEIVSSSQENNTDKQITGVLISYKEHFLQYLEGDSVEIYALFNKIKNDTRHEAIHLLQYSPLPNRLFSNWSMAYKEISGLSDVSLSEHEEICVDGIRDVVHKNEFWKGIESIEVISNLINT